MPSPADLASLFAGFTRSAFRLETLPVYDVPEEASELRGYLSGEPPPANLGSGDDTAWRRTIRAATPAGKQFSRVRVVRSPIGDYLRYECEWGYVFNERLGEDIRILDLAEISYDGPLMPYDFWLFDDATGVRMHYTDGGSYLGADLVPSADLNELRACRDASTTAAVPFGHYWQAHPEYRRSP